MHIQSAFKLPGWPGSLLHGVDVLGVDVPRVTENEERRDGQQGVVHRMDARHVAMPRILHLRRGSRLEPFHAEHP